MNYKLFSILVYFCYEFFNEKWQQVDMASVKREQKLWKKTRLLLAHRAKCHTKFCRIAFSDFKYLMAKIMMTIGKEELEKRNVPFGNTQRSKKKFRKYKINVLAFLIENYVSLFFIINLNLL